MRPRTAAWGGLAGVLLAGLLIAHDPPPRPEAFDEDWALEAARVDWVIPGLELQYFDGVRLWATRHLQIWTSEDEGLTWSRRGHAVSAESGAWARARSALGRARLARWAVPRRGIEALIVLDGGEILLSAPPWIQRSTDGGLTFERVLRHRPGRGILRHWAHRGDVVLFGEYGTSGGDHAVWRSDDRGTAWRRAWTLPALGQPGGGRHLHGVQFAPDGRPWVMVGDRDEDARLGPLVEGRVEPVAAGDQRAKATSLVFDDDGVLWGADAPAGPWGVFRWDAVGGLRSVASLDGPVLWSTRLADGSVVLATEVEGEGVDSASLWRSVAGAGWMRLLRAPASTGEDDRWGTISFPLGEPAPSLLGTVDRLGGLGRAAIRVVPDRP